MITPFIGFAPDLDSTTPGIITEASNLIPTLRGFSGAPAGISVGLPALAAAANAGAALYKLDGDTRMIIGAAAKLYEKSGSTWADVSRVAAYNASASTPWRFAQFGNTSLAINKGDVLQSSSTGAFADVAGAPKASVMCVTSSFVMLGNTNDGVNNDLDRWWCSAYLDETDWVTSITTQCTSGRLVDSPGPITGMRAFGYDVVAYKSRSMYLGRYAGPPSVWDFTLIPGEIGCSSQEAIADIGTAHIFIGDEDIYIFNGGLPQPIGSPLREWFFADLDPAQRHMIRHAIDRNNSIVYFYYPRQGSGGVINGCIAYNYKANKWGVAHRTIEAVIEYIAGGFTWDTLPVVGSTWDAWADIPYDSPYWTASSKYMAYIGTDHTVYSLTGSSDTASFTTGDVGVDNEYSLLTRATLRYLNKPTSATMTNSYQAEHGGDWTEDTTTTETTGRFDVMRSSVFHKARFNFVGDFELTGITVEMQPDGVL